MPETARRWLDWARQIQALAQTGLHYARNDFERERATRLLAIASEMVAEHTCLPAGEALTAFTAQPGYVTPKVDVRGAVFRGEEVLLVREATDGGWTLPGGWADVGESPARSVEREVWEEAGLRVHASRLVGVYDANRVEAALSLFHAYKIVFLCDVLSGELKPGPETSEVGYFPADNLPRPFSPHRTLDRHIADAWAMWRDPSLRAVFD